MTASLIDNQVDSPDAVQSASIEMETRQVILECLKDNAKDGTAWSRLSNIENCFW